MCNEQDKDKKKFFEKLAKILSVEINVLNSTSLKDINLYDSIAKLECSVLIEKEFGKFVLLSQIEKCKTANDLYNLRFDQNS